MLDKRRRSDDALLNKTRVLFFAWGDSIHARRRIGVFTSDDNFIVGIVSNYKYNFEGVKNYHLSNVIEKSTNFSFRLKLFYISINFIAKFVCNAFKLLGKKIEHYECHSVLEDIFLVRKYVKEFEPDVIFMQTLLYPNYLSFFINKRIPTIITFWNGDLTWWAQYTGFERSYKKRIVSYGIKRATAITVNSETALKACCSYGGNSEKIKLIRYPGIKSDHFNAQISQQTARKRIGLQHRNIILCPRGLGGYLNSDIIIEAAALVVEKCPDTLFVFVSDVGGADLWEQHFQRAKELGIQNNVRRDGKVAWEQMPLYYRAANIMVSISSNDSLPNCMLEAMACGIPVIMGNIPQIREWVTNGDNGICVPPRDPVILANQLVLLLTNGALVNKFVLKNLQLVRSTVESDMVCRSIKKLVKSVAHGSS